MHQQSPSSNHLDQAEAQPHQYCHHAPTMPLLSPARAELTSSTPAHKAIAPICAADGVCESSACTVEPQTAVGVSSSTWDDWDDDEEDVVLEPTHVHAAQAPLSQVPVVTSSQLPANSEVEVVGFGMDSLKADPTARHQSSSPPIGAGSTGGWAIALSDHRLMEAAAFIQCVGLGTGDDADHGRDIEAHADVAGSIDITTQSSAITSRVVAAMHSLLTRDQCDQLRFLNQLACKRR